MKKYSVFLFCALITFSSCEKLPADGVKLVEDDTKMNCSIPINTKNIYFILPNSSKIQLDYFGDMEIEQFTKTSRRVRITFNPKKLADGLKKASDEYKVIYPNHEFSYRMSISDKIDDNTPLGFLEKYKSGVTGVGIDQLYSLTNDKLTWDDLIKLVGGTPSQSREIIGLSKDENIYLIIYGVHINLSTNKAEYWPRNQIKIDSTYCY